MGITSEKLSQLNQVELQIYSCCYNRSRNIYDIIAYLSENNLTVAYSTLCQKLGIMSAKGFLSRYSKGRLVLYKSIPEKEEVKDAVV